MSTYHLKDFPDELHRRFKAVCSLRGETMRDRILELVRVYVEQQEKKRKK